MIHILGLILKIIGWILLGILGVLLGILLFVLFSAIRYRIDGEKREELKGQVKVTWLLWILSVNVCYQEKLSIRVAVFGYPVWQMGQDEGSGKKKGRRRKKGKEKEIDPEEENRSQELIGEERGEAEALRETEGEAGEKEGAGGETAGGETEGEAGVGSLETSERCLKNPSSQEEGERTGEERASAAKDAKTGMRKGVGSLREFFSQKIQQIFSFFQKVRFSISSFCDKLKQTGERIEELEEKAEKLAAFLQDPANHKSAKLILGQVRKILVYLLPKKGKGELTLGLEDPYALGQVLSAVSIGYPWLHKVFQFHPVFDQKVFEGEVHVKGHIRIGVLLWYVLRLLLDGNIRRRLWKLIRGK